MSQLFKASLSHQQTHLIVVYPRFQTTACYFHKKDVKVYQITYIMYMLGLLILSQQSTISSVAF